MQTGNFNIRLLSLIAIFVLGNLLGNASHAQPPPQIQTLPGAFPTVPNSMQFRQPENVVLAPEQTGLEATPAAPLQSQSIRFNDPSETDGTLQISARDQRVSIFARGVDLRVVLGNLAEESRVNIVVAENVEATVTTTLNNVLLWDALDAILRINGLEWSQKGEIIFVTRPGGGTNAVPTSNSPGLQLQVFDLNYTSSAEVLEVVKGLLSPGGKAFSHVVDKTNERQTRERVVVEDFPDRLAAISGYLASVDNAPLQVLIEAHVLQVNLADNQRHGVNLTGLLRVAGGRVNVQAQGFANGDASPGFMLGLDGNDLDGMLETLCSDSNVRTLAAPKVLAVNGQEARIQIGSRFGYFLTTTTQTSSLQSVDFLEIGVVLRVTPTITDDGRIMMVVAPKVSGGRINPDSGLPEEDTTETETTVLLPNGKGMIIGGLIKESDTVNNSWVPWLGKQRFIGRLFSRTNKEMLRSEVIIALTPRIVPYDHIDHRERMSYAAATSTKGIITNNQQGASLAGEIPVYIDSYPDTGMSHQSMTPPQSGTPIVAPQAQPLQIQSSDDLDGRVHRPEFNYSWPTNPSLP